MFNPRLFLFLIISSVFLFAADDRVSRPIDNSHRVAVKGNVHPRANPASDQGPISPDVAMNDLTVLMKPGPGLDQLLLEQRTPGSPNYHRWLTPEQFGERFGLSAADLGKMTQWLESQGLHVDQVARGRHWISFSGTARDVGRAFGTQIHRYSAGGKTNFANSADLTVPEALKDIVAGFDGFNDFGAGPSPTPRFPAYNLGGVHYLSPGDFATIYNLTPFYQNGIDGTGQKIVIVGQSPINVADIQAFRKHFNFAANDPQMVLVGINPGTDPGFMLEGDLDVEWAGAIAPKASVTYVYAANVTTAVKYAIDQNLAPVISESFVFCEQGVSLAQRYLAQQANAQGITWVAGSGDWGAAACDFTSPIFQASKGATVGYPASIPEVTGVGGTMFNEGSGTYWSSSNDPNLVSAMSYIPEISWNDATASDGLLKSGGGASSLFSKPLWQTGPGVPNDSARDVPDISFTAGSSHDGYVFISSGNLVVVGGTSAATPAFAGILALLNHYLTANGKLSRSGLGNINPILYRMAQSVPDTFHDITTGDNFVPCEQGSPGCVNGSLGFSAGPGYDQVTGLGSVDAFKLATNWNAGTASNTSLAAVPSSVNVDDTVALTATVNGGGAAPTGIVSFVSGDTLLGTANLSPAGGGASASLNVPAYRIVGGTGQVSAVYDGNAVYSPSGATATVTLNLPASGSMVVADIVPATAPPQATNVGPAWIITITLTEKAGVATKLTGMKINGTDYSSQISSFFPSTNIPANGTLSTSLGATMIAPPLDQVFVFSGTDASGATWTRQATVTLSTPAGPLLYPAMTLTSSPGTVVQNAQADPSCQWQQTLTIQETGGFSIVLTRLTVDGTNFTSQLQQTFGTLRLAPFGILQGAMCWSGVSAPSTKSYVLSGTAEDGVPITANLSASFTTAAQSPAKLTVGSASAVIPVANASATGSGTIAISLGGAAVAWKVSVVLPSGAQWLTASPSSGTSDGQITLNASGSGLSNGAYRAYVTIQSDAAVPQIVTVPVTLVVGASATASIGGVANNFSGSTTAVPGMMMAVFGSGLAPAGTSGSASGLPLPLGMSGVSATVNGISAPLYYVSPGQLDIQVPYEAGAGPAVLAINNNGDITSFQFPIAVAAPGMASVGSTLTVIDPVAGGYASSVKIGSIYTIYMTGDGDVSPTLPTGATPTAGTSAANLPKPRLPVAVTIGGVAATVNFVGIPSGLAGVTQINFTVPSGASAGSQPVIVTVGTVPSPPAMVTVTQ
jgi:uncharacterized protein (TIGR03437 family)